MARKMIRYRNFTAYWSADFAKKASRTRRAGTALCALWGTLKGIKYALPASVLEWSLLSLRETLSGGADMASAVGFAGAAAACVAIAGLFMAFEDLTAVGRLMRSYEKKARRAEKMGMLAGGGAFYARTDAKGRIELHRAAGGEVTFHRIRPGTVTVAYGAAEASYDMDADAMTVPYSWLDPEKKEKTR